MSTDVCGLMALVVGFVGLALVAHRVQDGTALDHALLDWLVAHRHHGLTTAAIVVTNAGSPGSMWPLAVIAGAILSARYSPLTGIVVLATLASAYGLSTLTKTVAGAQRPPRATQLLLEIDPSYPSGHVTGTLALVGIVAVVLGRGRSLAIRVACGVGVAAVTVVVALTRLYLGVHWLTDVVGGSLLGGTAVLIGSLALRAFAPTPSRNSGQRAESSGPKGTWVA